MKIRKRQPIFLDYCQKFCQDPQNEILKKNIETWMEEHGEIIKQSVILPTRVRSVIPRERIPWLIRRIQSGTDAKTYEEELLALANEVSRRATE